VSEVKQNFRVLAVDDDEDILNTYYQYLECIEDDSDSILEIEKLISENSVLLQEESQDKNKRDCFKLSAVTSGELAIEKVKQAIAIDESFFVALIDMRMPPGIDGAETAQRLRQIDPNIYIIIVTAYSDIDPAYLNSRLQHSFLYMRKPFNVEELVQACRTFQQAWHKDRIIDKSLEIERKLNRQEQQSAKLAGAQEISNSILHNMGNSLSSIDHISNKIEESVNGMDRLPKVFSHFIAELSAIEDDKEKFVRMEAQYGELSRWVEQEVGNNLKQQCTNLNGVVHHVIEVLHTHRRNSGSGEICDELQLQEIVDDTLLVLEIYTNNRRIELAVEIDGVDSPLQWPRNSMVQLIVNLLKNSFESIEEEMARRIESGAEYQPSISIAAFYINAEKSGKMVSIVIKDNGAGVSAEMVDKLFSYGETSKQKGSGIGLHWSRKQLQSYGGNVELESAGDGKGATVTLIIPTVINIKVE
jgi:signal transduction histidine kinase